MFRFDNVPYVLNIDSNRFKVLINLEGSSSSAQVSTSCLARVFTVSFRFVSNCCRLSLLLSTLESV